MTGSQNLLKFSFIAFSFMMLGGRSFQALGFYLFGIIIPLILMKSYNVKFKKSLIKLGILFLVLFFIFPLSDLLVYFLDSEIASSVDIKWKKLFFSSQFSSSVGITGIFLLILGFKGKEISNPDGVIKPKFEFNFNIGMFIGTMVLATYVIIQYFTGFNFSEIADQRLDRVFGNGRFRVTGFSNHPMSFAGLSLVIFSYYWTAFWQKADFKNIKNNPSEIRNIIVLMMYIMFVFLSGSRGALLSLAAILILIPWIFSSLNTYYKLWVAGLSSIALVAGVFFSGIISRIQETLGQGSFSGLGERLIFWKVHYQLFLDNIFFGAGHYFLEEVTRNNYYQKLGFGGVAHKYNAHNLFLEILADVGIVGAITIISTVIFIGIEIKKISVNRSDLVGFKSLGVAFLGLLIFGLFQNTLFDTPSILMLLSIFWLHLWSTLSLDK